MNCLKCGGEVWDNIKENEKRKAEGKKERPIYSCKNKEGCGWVMWPEKGVKKVVVENSNPKSPKDPEVNYIREKCMVLSYAKDIVVAEMAAGQVAPEPVKQVLGHFTQLWSAFKETL